MPMRLPSDPLAVQRWPEDQGTDRTDAGAAAVCGDVRRVVHERGAHPVTITQIAFRRKVNCGNFESFDVEAAAAVIDGDDPDTAAIILQRFVDRVCADRVDILQRPGRQGGLDVGELPPQQGVQP